MKFFTIGDFAFLGDMAQPLCDITNEKLERESMICYAYHNRDRFIISGNKDMATHKALIFNIQPIIKDCEHLADKVSKFSEYQAEGLVSYWQCQCGARVEPLAFVAVKTPC